MVVRRHGLGLLLVTWATSQGRIRYRDAVPRASSLIELPKIRPADREAFSSQLRQLEASGVVELIRSHRQVRWIESVRCYSSRDMWRRAFGDITTWLDRVPSGVLNYLKWKDLSDHAKAEFLWVFATEAFRAVISDAVFYRAKGLSNREVANAIWNTVPPSIAKALDLTSITKRLLVARLAELAAKMARARGAQITGWLIFVSIAPPSVASKGPRWEHEKMVVRYAEGMAWRLIRVKPEALTKLLGFPMFLWAYSIRHEGRHEGATLPELWEKKSPIEPLERRNFRRMTREIERAGQ